jgi:hypothetical protein
VGRATRLQWSFGVKGESGLCHSAEDVAVQRVFLEWEASSAVLRVLTKDSTCRLSFFLKVQ